MKKVKAAGTVQTEALTQSPELEAINRFAKTQLQAEDVYTFSVLLCDNEVDRDFERFTEATLQELRDLFVGKTGIANHDWNSELQMARIYRTELVTEPSRKTSVGTPYCYLKGYAYMLRTEENAGRIAEIEGGIKKEVSVGCSVARSRCSICGEELGSAGCSHIPGTEYGGKLCYAELEGAVDAYEWSFVAVPAQREAGVMKRFGKQAADLKGFVESEQGGTYRAEYLALQKDAEAGRTLLCALRQEVLRLGLLCDRSTYLALQAGAQHMDAEALQSMKAELEERLEQRFPPVTQLPGQNEVIRFDGGAYLI